MKRIILLFFVSFFSFFVHAQIFKYSTYQKQSGSLSDDAWQPYLNFVGFSDNIYLNSEIANGGMSSKVLFLSRFNFNLPSATKINGIEVTVERFAETGNAIQDQIVQLLVNGNQVGENKALTTPTPKWTPDERMVTYGGPTDKWGLGLTVDQVNSLNFGMAFQATNTQPDNGGGGHVTAFIDAIYITVYFEVNVVTPVNFINFDAKKINAGTQLTWKVGAEDNVKGYEVEKSVNGSAFSKIAFVPATAGSMYTFTDAQASLQTVYFRIRNVDNDGKSTYSPVIRFSNGNTGVELKAFPSLVTGGNFRLQHDAAVSGSGIIISSLSGSLVKKVIPATGSMQTPVDVSGLQPGMYLVRFVNGNGQPQTMKVVIQ